MFFGKDTKLDREAVFEQLKIDEGVKYEIYNDHLGYPTFGVGHLITKEDEEFGLDVGTKVSADRVKSVFMKDLHTSIRECLILYREDYFDDWPGEVQEILVNMMFNLGRPRLSKFKNMRTAIDNEDWATAATEGRDSSWFRQVGNRAERLMERLENV